MKKILFLLMGLATTAAGCAASTPPASPAGVRTAPTVNVQTATTTRETIDTYISKDAAHVYFMIGHGDDVIPDADPRTFTVIAYNEGAKNDTIFAKDALHVFYYGGWGDTTMSIIKGADPKTFTVLDHDSYSGGYSKDAKNVFWGDVRLDGADPKTFVSHPPYGWDTNRVYLGQFSHEVTVIQGADPKTFVLLNYPPIDNSGAGYSKDGTSVFIREKKIPGADAPTFHLVTEGADARDKNHGYSAGEMIY